MLIYETPEMEITVFAEEDVIHTSEPVGLINGGIGSGDSSDFSDLFPGLG